MMKRKILVVDDELDMRVFLCNLLKMDGYEAVDVKDSEEGMQKAREIKPGLIILDMMMPGDGGIRMYRWLKRDEELMHIPVIMLSDIGQKSLFHSQALMDTSAGGAVPTPDAYLEKPPQSEEILRWARELIEERNTG